MTNIEVSKNQNEKHYKINTDIDEILSGDSKENLKITKIQNDTDQKKSNIINDKVELSSQKDVTIGLDLLVNKEKVNNRIEISNNDEKPINLSLNNNDTDTDTNNVINLDQNNEIDFETMIKDPSSSNEKKMLDNLNIDRTSRLSQSEIDAYIDRQDEKENIIDKISKDKISKLSDLHHIDQDKISRHSNKSRESKRSENTNHSVSYEKYQKSMPPMPPMPPGVNYYQPKPYIDPVKERAEKEEILWQLEKYRRLGIQGIRKFNMSSDLEDMRAEYNKVKKQRELENSIKFQRKCLVAFATGTELINNKLDFLDFKLDGWSEQVNENVDEYNEVFEELHEKYKEKAKMAPELKLIFMLGGSAFMYHLTNSMFKNSIPGMEDIMRQNPDLMKQFANAAINQMDGEKQSAAKFFNNFAPQNTPSMAGDRPMPDAPSFFSANSSVNPNSNRPIPQPSNMFNSSQYRSGPSPRASHAKNDVEEITSRHSSKIPFNNGTKKIPAPTGVDDILNELKSNTDRPRDDISEVISRTSTKNIRIQQKRPKKSININLN